MCMDNASNCDSLAEHLETRLILDEDLTRHAFEGLKSRTRCFGHIGNIAMEVNPICFLTRILTNVVIQTFLRVFLKEVKGKKLTAVENIAALERIEVQEHDSELNISSNTPNDDNEAPLPPNVDFDELDAETSNVITLLPHERQEACMMLTKVCVVLSCQFRRIC